MNRRFFVWNSLAGVASFKKCLSFIQEGIFTIRGQSARAPGAGVAGPSAGNTSQPLRAITLEFGVQDIAPARWDGEAAISEGSIVEIRGHNFGEDDQVIDGLHWRAATTSWPPYVGTGDLNPTEQPRPHATPVKTVGVTIYFRGPDSAQIHVRIVGAEFGYPLQKIAGSAEAPFMANPLKEFEFRVADVPEFGPLYLVGARILAFRTPPVEQISGPGNYVDYPSLALDREGNLWAAWVGYNNSADEIWLRRSSQGSWSEPVKVSENPGDVSSCDAAADGEGRIWVVWSERRGSDWHLMARRYDPGSWSPIKQLTTGTGNNLFARLAADGQGNLHLVWQSFRGGASSIFLMSLHGDVWQDEIKLSDSKKGSRTNDWCPAVAADRTGTVWVAWDTYHPGSYNILLRSVRNGVPGELLRVTDSARFHAHPSLAVDDQNRLWVAYDEAEENWGKDVGYQFAGGAGLYQSRTICFAIRSGDQWFQPCSDLQNAMPPGSQGFVQLPRLIPNSKGGIWVLFRSRTQAAVTMTRFAALGRWEVMASSYSGDRWSAPVVFPESAVMHNQESPIHGVAELEGRCWAVWAAEGIFAAAFPAAEVKPMVFGPRAAEPPTLKPSEPREPDNVAAIRNYSIQIGGKTYKIYRGDMHRHTEISLDGAGEGSLCDAYRYAMDAADFDFVAITDHMQHMNDYSWWRGEKAADMFHVPGFFIALFGYERSIGYPNGHRNVVAPRRGVRFLPVGPNENMGHGKTQAWDLIDTGMEMAAGQPLGNQARDVERSATILYPYLRKHGAIAMAHTPVNAVMGTDWGGEKGFTTDPEVEPLVEIFQGARISSEHEGAPLAPSKHRPELQHGEAGGYQPQGWVWNAWAKGYKLGVQASSDHISTHCSYSCVVANEGTREGLLDAMRRRHCYGATTNILLDFRLRNESAEYLMGDEVHTRVIPSLAVKVIGTNTVAQVHVIRDNQYVHAEKGSGPEVEFHYREDTLDPGEHYYYVRAEQTDGHVAWASPIWVKYQP